MTVRPPDRRREGLSAAKRQESSLASEASTADDSAESRVKGPAPHWRQLRYKVVFTPVGWQVVDKTGETMGEVAAFGTGPEEYERAKTEARRLNKGGSHA